VSVPTSESTKKSLVEDRKAAFTSSASAAAASQTTYQVLPAPNPVGSSYTGKSYPVPASRTGSGTTSSRVSSTAAQVPSAAPAGEDVGTSKPGSLAERRQNYQRQASSNNMEATTSSQVSAPSSSSVRKPPSAQNDTKPPVSISTTSASIDDKADANSLPNLHNGTLSMDSIVAELQNRPQRLDERDSNGRTPLLAACFSKKWELAAYFIEKGADVSAKDKVCGSLLHRKKKVLHDKFVFTVWSDSHHFCQHVRTN
jgi:hypothetical protein